jgi:hypothetical protein
MHVTWIAAFLTLLVNYSNALFPIEFSACSETISLTRVAAQKSNKSSYLHALKKANKAALKNGLYGAAAGSFQVISLMWLRTIINYQYRYGVSTRVAIHSLYSEGGLLRFYRGMPFALIQNPLTKFGAVAANEGSRVLVEQLTGSAAPSPLVTSVLGTLFSIGWKLILVPLETMKTVLQVDGTEGFNNLLKEVMIGNWRRLYAGGLITVLSTILSHYPWFYVHNLLDLWIEKSEDSRWLIARSAFIGFVASVTSDCFSNIFRVVKTLRQTIGEEEAYMAVFMRLYEDEGLLQLATRGLFTRILANGLQSIVFVIAWKFIPFYLNKLRSHWKKSNI